MQIRKNTKLMTINALLLGLGLILHEITPVLALPMEVDFALIMLFTIIIINNNLKFSLISGGLMGIFTAMTTKFPGGQLPNIIDKLLTALIVFILLALLRKSYFLRGLSEERKNNLLMAIILPLGTIISGSIFLSFAKIIVGLPTGFLILFFSVILPSALLNTICGLFLYKIIIRALRSVAYNL